MKIIETVKTPNTVFTIEFENDLYKVCAVDNHNPDHKIELSASLLLADAKQDFDTELHVLCWDCGQEEIKGHTTTCGMMFKLS